MEKFVDIPQNVEKFISHVGDLEKIRFEEELTLYINVFSQMDSPIEQLFYVALHFQIRAQELPETEIQIEIINQCEIENFRVDFLISGFNKNVIVELDGHNFHEMAEKERRYEKSRDRYFQKKGYKVFHYTGKEITDNPFNAVNEVLAFITDNNFTEYDQYYNSWKI